MTDILVLNGGGLLDQSAGLSDVLKGITLYPELVNVLLVSDDGDAFSAVDFPNDFLSDEVLDFDGLVVVDDVDEDGEMRVCESHLELIARGDSSDHVFNVRGHGLNGTLLLSSAEPHCINQTYFARALWCQSWTSS